MNLNSIQPKLSQIHEFWFKGYPDKLVNYQELMRFWYSKNTQIDDLIRNEYELVVDFLLSENFNVYELNVKQHSKKELMNIIIALDQFPRNIYRNNPKSFQGDPKALALTKKILNQPHLLDKFGFLEKMFILLPLEHSENMDDQLQCVKIYDQLKATESDPVMSKMVNGVYDYVIAHKVIVEKFGRFPHRNHILGRPNTQEEDEYLNNGGTTF